ncbi:uncharacterized protein Z518_09448 [Rhinocladiella mackenziei CBS 650.93]|uniref:Kynurenine formamidase n=1 Tax=Rhinocladiella mackenziei CBS 650.93 TaxID=1442369 RepID=A0A0D2FI77_9EURO|nr:uncharacterized protein Z518_09448 [Rhinocladiella mackenziei CBS 650.93]KIX01722.1 hypothetical protein Z518_09448 [Rhinocladiella mackenziei CBS 650.93]
MKRVIRYFQDQAVQASEQKYSGSAYLSPQTKEPQQRMTHHSRSHYKDQHNAHHQSRSKHPSTAAHSFPAHTSGGVGIPKSNGQREPSPPAIPEKLQRDITRHQYAQDNILQSYELYVPELDSFHLSDLKGNRYWVIYIHGGYFRDPTVTSSSFYPALSNLISHAHNHTLRRHFKSHTETTSSDKDIASHIAGYASLNYRLSPHPQSPQDLDTTSTYELRNAQWPDHLHDILTAIAHLQAKYGFGERYLLVGHSVGATMAVLSTLVAEKSFRDPRNLAKSDLPKIDPPMAVLGVSGIYDFPLLHDSFPSYVELTRNAIPDASDDNAASPAKFSAQDYLDIWASGDGKGKKNRAMILAHSREDGLVDWKQVEAMERIFGPEPTLQGESSGKIVWKVVQLKGKHNEIWEKGHELGRVIREAVGVMRDLDQ